MNRPTKKSLLVASIVLMLIALTMSIRYFTRNGMISPRFGLLRNIIHICLLTSWGISIHLRIIQTQVRRYLLTIAFMMASWMLLKIVNYSLDSMDVNRLLWYLYYIPMLFIPTAALFISMSLGKAENYQLPQWTKLLYIPTVSLFLLVFTNDLHCFVFSFPSGIMTPVSYRHELGYYIVLGWIFLCALASLAMMIIKCRIPYSRTFLVAPLIPLGLSLIYTIAYIRNIPWVLLLAGDMTITHCLLIAAVFEACIQCGLIHSNIGYRELFEATTLPIQVTNTDFSLKHSSAAMQKPLPQSMLRQMKADSINLDSDTLLKRYVLRDAYVFWEEDISELNRLEAALEQTRDELREMGDVLAAENAQQEKLLRLSEENRLYDMMVSQTASQLAMLRARLKGIREAEDPAIAKKLLGQAIIIGTYIKRRNNMIFVGAQQGRISAQELALCFNETIENLSLYGVECRALIDGNAPFTMEQATQIYDLFEKVIETELESLDSLLLSVEAAGSNESKAFGADTDEIEVNICISGKESLCKLKDDFPGTEWTQDDDGLQYITQKLVNQGGK